MVFLGWIVGVFAVLGGLWWLASGTAARRERARRPRDWKTASRVAVELAPAGAAVPVSASRYAVSADVPSSAAPEPEHAADLHLLDDALLTPDVALRLTMLADNLPRPRAVTAQLLQAGADPAELARVVATDPATAALLLRTVNSAQFQLAHEITSVQHAITYLGANLVRDIAIRHAMAVPMATRNLAAERIYQGLWRNSYLASAITMALAKKVGLSSPAELSTHALLFSLGDITLVAHQPELASLYQADSDLSELVDATQRRLSFNASMVAAHLGQVWQLPQGLCRVLRKCLTPLVSGPEVVDQALLPGVTLGYFSTRLAHALARQVDFDLRMAIDELMSRREAQFLPAYLAALKIAAPRDLLSDPALDRRLAALVEGVTTAL